MAKKDATGRTFTVVHEQVGSRMRGETFRESEAGDAELDRLLALGAITEGQDLPETEPVTGLVEPVPVGGAAAVAEAGAVEPTPGA